MMALGDNRFSRITTDFNMLLELNGVDVTITRTEQSQITNRDIFGMPEGYTPNTFTVKVLVTDQYLDETTVIAGGKPKEILKIMALPGTFVENDDISYNSHSYQVTDVEKISLSGNDSLELYSATRQVEV
jgi:hypothetical protein